MMHPWPNHKITCDSCGLEGERIKDVGIRPNDWYLIDRMNLGKPLDFCCWNCLSAFISLHDYAQVEALRENLRVKFEQELRNKK